MTRSPEVLSAVEVAALLGMNAKTFRRFQAANPGFPRPVILGKTEKGKPIIRWRRRQVDAFIDLLGS